QDVHHVRRAQPRDRLGLAREALANAAIAGQVLQDEFDGARAVQLPVVRFPHFTHATATDDLREGIAIAYDEARLRDEHVRALHLRCYAAVRGTARSSARTLVFS